MRARISTCNARERCGLRRSAALKRASHAVVVAEAAAGYLDVAVAAAAAFVAELLALLVTVMLPCVPKASGGRAIVVGTYFEEFPEGSPWDSIAA